MPRAKMGADCAYKDFKVGYPESRAKSWQIGSGPTEAECKTTTHRVKGRGRRWNTDNAEAMMALAALHDSRLWHQRWTNLDPQRNAGPP